MLGFRFSTFRSFSKGIFYHMLLGDKNDRVPEKDKRSCQAQGRVQLATLSLYLGVPLRRAEISQDLG